LRQRRTLQCVSTATTTTAARTTARLLKWCAGRRAVPYYRLRCFFALLYLKIEKKGEKEKFNLDHFI